MIYIKNQYIYQIVFDINQGFGNNNNLKIFIGKFIVRLLVLCEIQRWTDSWIIITVGIQLSESQLRSPLQHTWPWPEN